VEVAVMMAVVFKVWQITCLEHERKEFIMAKYDHPSDSSGRPGVTRREALWMLGASMMAGPSLATSSSSVSSSSPPSASARPSCIVTPQQTEGPYFSDLRLQRADIRSDPTDGSVRPGVPLLLTLRVQAITGNRCTPMAGAIVDIWHCDANGRYSDARDSEADTRGKKFLRGYQLTDANGLARFNTIYPGAYPGRAVHVHFKVRTKPNEPGGMEFTSQLYFPEQISERVYANPLYGRTSAAFQKNGSDGLFRRGGQALMLDLVSQQDGYAGRFDIGMMLG
jgi:protocatechuate 3,4-dioxygenase beta subunit